MTAPPLTPRELFVRSLIPGTSGGLYALIPAAIGFFTVVGMFVYSGVTGKPMPGETGAILTACVTMLMAHQVRGSLADKANADNGVVPVPAEGPPVDVPEPAGAPTAQAQGVQ